MHRVPDTSTERACEIEILVGHIRRSHPVGANTWTLGQQQISLVLPRNDQLGQFFLLLPHRVLRLISYFGIRLMVPNGNISLEILTGAWRGLKLQKPIEALMGVHVAAGINFAQSGWTDEFLDGCH